MAPSSCSEASASASQHSQGTESRLRPPSSASSCSRAPAGSATLPSSARQATTTASSAGSSTSPRTRARRTPSQHEREGICTGSLVKAWSSNLLDLCVSCDTSGLGSVKPGERSVRWDNELRPRAHRHASSRRSRRSRRPRAFDNQDGDPVARGHFGGVGAVGARDAVPSATASCIWSLTSCRVRNRSRRRVCAATRLTARTSRTSPSATARRCASCRGSSAATCRAVSRRVPAQPRGARLSKWITEVEFLRNEVRLVRRPHSIHDCSPGRTLSAMIS